jgi:hypothetical protein
MGSAYSMRVGDELFSIFMLDIRLDGWKPRNASLKILPTIM